MVPYSLNTSREACRWVNQWNCLTTKVWKRDSGNIIHQWKSSVNTYHQPFTSYSEETPSYPTFSVVDRSERLGTIQTNTWSVLNPTGNQDITRTGWHLPKKTEETVKLQSHSWYMSNTAQVESPVLEEWWRAKVICPQKRVRQGLVSTDCQGWPPALAWVCNTMKDHRTKTARWERLSTAPAKGIPDLVQWLCL